MDENKEYDVEMTGDNTDFDDFSDEFDDTEYDGSGDFDDTEFDDQDEFDDSFSDEPDGEQFSDDIEGNEFDDDEFGESDFSDEEADDLSKSTDEIDDEAFSDDNNFVGLTDDGEIIEDDRELPIDADGNLKIMQEGKSNKAFEFKYIDINDIVVGDRIRKSSGSIALTTSVQNTGLLMPIVVAPTATDGVYVLINGLKRLVSCAKSGIKEIPCVINKNAKTTELRILEAMYNHSDSYKISEILDFIDYLEKERGITNPTTIEYLLQMETGDYTKLKDIMADGDDNIVTPLLNGQITIGQAFKKLESRRKKESKEEKEIKKAEEVYSDTEAAGTSEIDEVGEIGDPNVVLTPEELKDLGFTADQLDDNIEGKDLADMVKEGKEMEGFEPHKQDWKDREILDPALRKAVLARDNNTSRVDPNISGQEYTECLDVHHIHEVYLGGTDDIDNLITVDTISHKLIHLYARGELHIGDIESKTDAEKEKFKRIIELGNVIRKDMQARGMKVEELKKVDNADTIGRTKPGTGQQAG